MTSAEVDYRPIRFRDRHDAGRRLAAELLAYRDEDPVVIGLPRGGVPVAEEIAAALGAPLDVLAVRKLGAPHNPEYGIGAIAEGGIRVFDSEALAVLGINGGALDSIVSREAEELRRRVAASRGERPLVDLRGRTAIVVDDGVATGSTAIAALQVARALGAARIVLATPVAPHDIERRVAPYADDVVALDTPRWFSAVGQFYDDFDQTSDAEVIAALAGGHGTAPVA
jgi:putative phosphoribosyl transferase